MSNFLPDLATWALGGGAGEGGSDNESGEGAGEASSSTPPGPALSEAEVRARRLTRMEAAMKNTVAASAISNDGDSMDVDPPASSATSKKASTSVTPMEISNTISSPPPKKATLVSTTPQSNSSSSSKKDDSRKRKSKESPSAFDTSSKKAQRKKELLMKKILAVSMKTGQSDASNVFVEVDDDEIGVHTIAELLATRLSLSSSQMITVPPQKPLMEYLGNAHRKAGEELKAIRNTEKNNKYAELKEILNEIQRQVVSYAASSLMEPDLFEQAANGTAQLSKALVHSSLDPTSSITFGVHGAGSSFWYKLCEELVTQDMETLDKVVSSVVAQILATLQKCDSIDSGVGESSALCLVSALTNLCQHKKAALAVTNLGTFLVPEEGTPAASEQIRPTMPGGADLLRMLAGENRPYLKRSGPGIEKRTLLGSCLRVSVPKNNPAFSPTSILRQSLDSVERSTNQLRRQLRVYQEAVNQFIMGLIKAGPIARGKVRKSHRWKIEWYFSNFL
jgi:hypothetical protein